MTPKSIRDLQTNEVLRKRLAKYMALHCFRNTNALEDLHAGKVPLSITRDYSDVRVLSAREDIPWKDLSRFDDEEMKVLMTEVVHKCNHFLGILFATSAADEIIEELKKRDVLPKWNDPE